MESDFIPQILWLLIKNKKCHEIGLAPLTEYKNHLSPIVETNHSVPTKLIRFSQSFEQMKAKYEEEVLKYYQFLISNKLFFPGRYGDWVKCTYFELDGGYFLNIDLIGVKAWVKATLSADLGVFIKNQNKVFFVCIVRKNTPGQGLPAIIGGIMNCGRELDSGSYTMIKEGEEEASLILEYEGDIEKLRTNHLLTKIPVIVKGFEKVDPSLDSIFANMVYITTVPTTEQERNADGNKRVYTTQCYSILIDLGDFDMSIQILHNIFMAGDDASAIHIQDITPYFYGTESLAKNPKYIPKFGLAHHENLFKLMIEFYKKQKMEKK
jgi:hypothetical protein